MNNKILNMEKMSKKLSKKIVSTIKSSIKDLNNPVKSQNINNNIYWCNYNEDVSNKIRTLILNIIKYKDNSNLNINLRQNDVYISIGNVGNIKKSTSASISNGKNVESYLEINLIKDKGFNFNYNYINQVYFNDKKIFDELYDRIVSKYDELSMYKFNTSYKEILDLSGLNREYNLQNLLDTE